MPQKPSIGPLSIHLPTRDDDCEYLFVSERRPYCQIKPAAIEKIVRNIYARTDGKISTHVTPHILRHTTATMAMQSGMPIVDISKRWVTKRLTQR